MPSTKMFPKKLLRCFILSAIMINIMLSYISPILGDEQGIILDKGWVMKTGDNPEWSKPDFDDGDWPPVRVDLPWEETGHPNYDGYAWYRLKFEVPESWKPRDVHGFISLSLGAIDDVDVTYVNGEQIGSTGAMPPDYHTAYYTPRFYRIPTRIVKWSEENVLAIRVYDGQGDGGLYQGPVSLRLPSFADLMDITFQVDSNGIYFYPDPLPVGINLHNYSQIDLDLNLVLTLANDRVDTVRTFEAREDSMFIRSKSKIAVTETFSPPRPGFYRVICTINDSLIQSMVFGYSPEIIETPLTREADFNEFWNQRKQDLAVIAPDYKMMKSEQSNAELDVYLVEMMSYGKVNIRGWYSVPKKPGPHAAILSVPGYTSTMWPNLQRTNVATFALNPRGHGNSKDDIDPRGEEYMFIGFDPQHPENYIYAGAFMDCLRAVDFLTSRPEIDAERIGIEGESQGGGLSFATAALDNRIVFCAPDIPWLCDWVGYLETEYWGWENYPKLFEKHPDLTFTGVNRFLSYFDTMNMAEWITCPVLMSVGLQDKVCPPRTSFATYNNVTAEKEYRVYPYAGHSTGRQHSEVKNKWMAKILGVEETGL